LLPAIDRRTPPTTMLSLIGRLPRGFDGYWEQADRIILGNFAKRWQYALPLILVGVTLGASDAPPPSTAPYEPDDASIPLLPTGISDYDVWVTSKLAYTWKQNGVPTVLYRGHFELRMGQRRLRSDEAVIWITNCEYQGRPFIKLDVFLWQNAEIRETLGTISTAPVFLVTVQTFGRVELGADATSMESQADTSLYKNAVDTRHLIDVQEAAVAEASPAPAPAEGKVTPAEKAALAQLTMPAKTPSKKGIRPGEEPSPMQVKGVDNRLGIGGLPKGPKRVTYRGRELQIDSKKGIVTAAGDVYVSQAGDGPGDLLEIKANAAVLFLAEGVTGGGLGSLMGEGAGGGKKSTTKQGGEQIKLEEAGRDDGTGMGAKTPTQTISEMVKGAYLEGDVVLSRGDRMIRASQIYYDFENNRALILDAVMRIVEQDRGVPILVRAQTVRQLSSTEYVATHAKITSSEFYTPYYHIGADRVYIRDQTARDSSGHVVGLTAGSYEMYNSTFNVGGVPVAYWPYTKGEFKQGEMTLRSLRVGYASDFGATFETKWYLFNLLGMEQPKGYDAWLNLDYYTKRGPGVGINVDYKRDNYYGLFRSYFIYDQGEDDLGPWGDTKPPDETRGRATWRHRQYLPKDWELTLEASYISDAGFLQEYEEKEFFEGKDQETLMYLEKRNGHWAFTALAQWRVMDFLTQTEHLPDLGFYMIGQDIGGVATAFSESHAGLVRYLPDNRRIFDTNRYNDNTDRSPVTPRFDERGELNLPLTLGPVKVVPFTTLRGSYWSSTPTYAEWDDISGAAWRGFVNYGAKASTYFSRAYPDVQSRLFDINGIKHIIEPEAAGWMAHQNLTSMDLYPFDQGIETVDAFGGGAGGIKQRWQTKRGGPGQWRIVDLLTWDLSVGAFQSSDGRPDQITHGQTYMSRPEDSIIANYVNSNLNYRLSDTTAFLWDFNWDMDRDRVGTTDVSIAVERLPRLGYFIGWRYIDVTESNLFGGGANYQLNEKHTVALRAYYDLEEGRMAEWTFTLLRRLPRWYVALTFGYDAVEDDWSITAAMWPEGLPEATFGSRKYTGLAYTTGIRPQESRAGLPAPTPTPPVEGE
jgi:hypothetical protein